MMDILFGFACLIVIILLLIIADKNKSLEYMGEEWQQDLQEISELKAARLALRTALRLARHMILTRAPMDTKAGKMFADALGEAWEPLKEEFYRSPKAGQQFGPPGPGRGGWAPEYRARLSPCPGLGGNCRATETYSGYCANENCRRPRCGGAPMIPPEPGKDCLLSDGQERELLAKEAR